MFLHLFLGFARDFTFSAICHSKFHFASHTSYVNIPLYIRSFVNSAKNWCGVCKKVGRC